MVKFGDWLTFGALLTIPAIFYTAATFYHLGHKNNALWIAIAISTAFAFGEYAFKTPMVMFGSNKGFSHLQIQMVWVVLTLSMAFILDAYKKNDI